MHQMEKMEDEMMDIEGYDVDEDDVNQDEEDMDVDLNELVRNIKNMHESASTTS